MYAADINKFIASGRLSGIDAQGFFVDLEPWHEEEVERRAAELGVTLTAIHWEVLVYIREHYTIHGPVSSARLLLKELGTAFADEGGRRFLYGLFPRGPVSQGSYIAGVPAPPHTYDLSFGTVE